MHFNVFPEEKSVINMSICKGVLSCYCGKDAKHYRPLELQLQHSQLIQADKKKTLLKGGQFQLFQCYMYTNNPF